MFISPSSPTHLLTGIAALVLATAAQAQATITCDQAHVTSRVPCVLTAAHSDGKPRTWAWSVVGMDDASQLLEPIGPDKVRVRTPVTLTERSFTVVAEDSEHPSVAGTFVLRITPNPQPGSGERALAEGIFPNAFTPSLVPFKGHPERTGYDDEGWGRSSRVEQIAFCDDGAMGPLDRCWILARGTGLEAFKVAGDPVPVPGFPYPDSSPRSCVAVATLPPGPGEVPAGAPRLVFCERETNATSVTGYRIYALEADGRKRLLAGGPGLGAKNGPGATARFSTVNGLALDRSGNVYVCEMVQRVRRIGLDGQVSTVNPADPVMPGGEINDPCCITVDPVTGDLYVGGRHSVKRVTPEGRLSYVIGGRDRALAAYRGFAGAPLHPGRVPLDTEFEVYPRSLAIHGRELFLADRQGIDAFHLDSRRLARIVPCNPDHAANRLGPVHYLNPYLPASRCAALRECGPLALTKEAMAIVAVGEGLAELELPDDPVTAIMDPPRNPSPTPSTAADAGRKETKETKDGARAPIEGAAADNLWPGQPLELGTVRPDGTWGVSHWRTAAPDQRFGGQCRVSARGLSQGWAQVCLLFADEYGQVLGHSRAAGPQMPDVVSAPAQGPTLLRMTGTAPAGTDRVALCIRVLKGNPGAVVAFEDVTFRHLP